MCRYSIVVLHRFRVDPFSYRNKMGTVLAAKKNYFNPSCSLPSKFARNVPWRSRHPKPRYRFFRAIPRNARTTSNDRTTNSNVYILLKHVSKNRMRSRRVDKKINEWHRMVHFSRLTAHNRCDAHWFNLVKNPVGFFFHLNVMNRWCLFAASPFGSPTIFVRIREPYAYSVKTLDTNEKSICVRRSELSTRSTGPDDTVKPDGHIHGGRWIISCIA